MKIRYSLPLTLLATASVGFAATTAQFDGGPDTPYQSGGLTANVPGIGSGVGPDGSDSFQLNHFGVTGEGNWMAFDRADVGSPSTVPFSFQFRIGPAALPGANTTADGFAFAFFNTSASAYSPTAYGTTGAVPVLSEDPAAGGVLAFGIDTWANGAPNDAGASGHSDYNDVSLFSNGTLITANYDPRAAGLTLDDDVWHLASGTINMAAGTVSLTIDALNIFNNVAVPGLVPFEYRLGLGGRTGGETENVYLDNISVGVPVPEPASLGIAALSVGLLARRRRK